MKILTDFKNWLKEDLAFNILTVGGFILAFFFAGVGFIVTLIIGSIK